ncbi:molybdopterin-guanine dinucleotide biosynthesis protein B [Fredinandcohnia sp. 179-A 10B2 NHS]|uniref:molybdopterin-guanine dinucleotide biosynthesis protein B n=1 Tax=Fredinandcohnia sp. 179-A 10B2 NHS TaxID=3235176 RepID=UPI0039A32A42
MALDIMYPILQIVGFQNSGKTTLVEKLVQTGTANGLKVATLKHHGHNTGLDSLHIMKDSVRHRKAGAVLSGVEGGGSLQIEAITTDWRLDKLIKLYSFFEHDMILVEGYKNEDYPKVIMIREEKDVELLSSLKNIVAVISWIQIESQYPLFNIKDEKTYLNWLVRSSEVNE